jgi:alpha-N-arabinofuranosidase
MRLIRIVLTLTATLIATGPAAFAREAEHRFTNPVLPGGYPDPSICHADGAWYLVNSTFEYFPGLPIHRSTDLVNWELIGHALHRESQVTGAVNLVDVQSDGGIHAPSIRCRDGRFYVITTNVYTPPEPGGPTQFVNFVVTADDPAGPWSEPHVIEGAPGIDPDIFFDDDGRAWYVGTHAPAEPAFEGEGEIWLQELDTERWVLTGERHFLWRGACGGTWAEGPHIYQHDGRYYLLIAEGGTGLNHAVMIAVADRVTGPYRPNPRNPVLTSRHLAYDHWVNSTGHADLFELPDGRWYAVLLGVRSEIGLGSNMGRETFMVPVEWEREPFEWQPVKHDWPVFSPESGRVEKTYPAPLATPPRRPEPAWTDGFDGNALDLRWNFRRLPLPGSWSLTARPGHLRLAALAATVRERGRASLLGIRQTASAFRFTADMRFAPTADGSEAGMMLFQKDDRRVGFTVRREGGGHVLRLETAAGAAGVESARAALGDYTGAIRLQAEWRDGEYVFRWSPEAAEAYREFARLPGDALLSKGYTGAYLGLYATANGREQDDHADFDRVTYEPR